ncbi:MAG: DUF4177 domain-containing protein [Clostridiales bacterium]|nr:DUF4177 domain-containing protein [Clostridiales bacterium]
MKEYKMIYLNKGINFSREKDLDESARVLNQYIADGWELQQVISPSDIVGALVAVIYKEK